jgi:arsenate reductase
VTAPTGTKQRVLFVCTGNSARSQMAEALLRHLAGERYEALSAGVEPKGVHPLTVEVLRERGVDAGGLRSKHVDEFLGRSLIHHAILVCDSAQKRCPNIYPFAGQVHAWPFRDPAACEGTRDEQLALFREVRDEIEARLRQWLELPE